jgi:predicted nucleic acid-binding Zn ribbon protein
MAPRTCPNCHATVRRRITFCVRCGYELPSPDRSGQDPLKIVAFLIMGALLLAIVVLTVLERLR